MLGLVARAVEERNDLWRKDRDSFFSHCPALARGLGHGAFEKATAPRDVLGKLDTFKKCIAVIVDGDHSVRLDDNERILGKARSVST